MKRFIALLLTLAMLLSLCPATVWAEELHETAEKQIDIVNEETESSYVEMTNAPSVETKESAEDPVLTEEEVSKLNDLSEEHEETTYEAESVVISAPPLTSAATTTEARWGLATGEKNDQLPTEWVENGTLTEAMTYANSLTSGTAYIQLLQDVDTTESISFFSGKTTIFDLNGKTIDRGLTTEASSYVIYIGGKLTLCDTSSTDVSEQGKITGGYSSDKGGGVYIEKGTFTMSGGSITGNTATSHGGGVYVVEGTFIMNDGIISDNTASRNGGGVYLHSGTFTMNNGNISENTADYGGGVYLHSGTFTMNNGIISDNAAKYGGGVDVSSFTTFNMNGGFVSENTANFGGGVYVYGTMAVSGKPVIMENTANEMDNNLYLSSGKTITVGTLADGTSIGITAPSYVFASGGAEYADAGYFTSDKPPYVVTTSAGINLKLASVDGSQARWGLATGEKNDQLPTEWVENGTLTEAMTYANGLTFGTAYIQLLQDVDTTAALTFSGGKTTIFDLNGKTIDRGLTTATDYGYVIYVSGKLTLCDTSATDLGSQGKITGGNSSAGNYRWAGGGVYVNSGTFTMNGGTISENRAFNEGGGVYVASGTFAMNGGSISNNATTSSSSYESAGGGVYINGTFTMNGGTISGNTGAMCGGGVYISDFGTFTMNGGTIFGNTADQYGGGVYVGGYRGDGTFTMNRGTIFGNDASVGGGVYVNRGTFTMDGGTITENKANVGGGVYGVFTLNSGTISRNTAFDRGGGVCGALTMNGGFISGNRASFGGGVALEGTSTMKGGTIFGNSASTYSGGVYINGSKMTVSGVPVISDNFRDGTLNNETGLYEQGANGLEDSIYLKGNDNIMVSGALQEGAVISVKSATPTNTSPVTVAKGDNYTITTSDVAKFEFVSVDGSFAAIDSMNNALQLKLAMANLSGNSNVWSDGVVTLLLNVSGTGIAGVEGTLDYDSSVLEYVGCENVSDNWDLDYNSAKYVMTGIEFPVTDEVGILAVKFCVKSDVPEGTQLSVSFKDLILSDGSNDFNVGIVSWTGTAKGLAEARWGLATGTNNDEIPASWAYGALADAVTYANEITSGTAYIQLIKDVDTAAPLVFTEGKTTILDLNGRDIDRGLTKATRNGYVIDVRGSLTICDTSTTDVKNQGKITGGYNDGNGGGVWCYGTIIMNGGSISGNKAWSGGGAYVYGAFVMNSGAISENVASYYGGGVYLIHETFNMKGGSISGNTSQYGCGIYVYRGVLTMSDGVISGNAGGYGAGVYLGNSSTMQISDTPSITENFRNGTRNNETCVYEKGINGLADNVYLESDNIVTVVDELSSKAIIGITTNTMPGSTTPVVVAKGGYGHTITATEATKFVNDDGRSVGVLDSQNNAVKLQPTEILEFSSNTNWGNYGVSIFTSRNGSELSCDTSRVFVRWDSIYVACGNVDSQTVYLASPGNSEFYVEAQDGNDDPYTPVLGTWVDIGNGDWKFVRELTVEKPNEGETVVFIVTRYWTRYDQTMNEYIGEEATFTLIFDFAPVLTGKPNSTGAGLNIFSKLENGVLGIDDTIYGLGGSPVRFACGGEDNKTVYLTVDPMDDLKTWDDLTGVEISLDRVGTLLYNGWGNKVYALTVDNPNGDIVKVCANRSGLFYDNKGTTENHEDDEIVPFDDPSLLVFDFHMSAGGSVYPLTINGIRIYSTCDEEGKLGYERTDDYDEMAYNDTVDAVMVPGRPCQEKELYLVSAEKLTLDTNTAGATLSVCSDVPVMDGYTVYRLTVPAKDSGIYTVSVTENTTGTKTAFEFWFNSVVFQRTSFYTIIDAETGKFSYKNRETCDGLSIQLSDIENSSENKYHLNVPFTAGLEKELYIVPNDGSIADVKVVGGSFFGSNLYSFEAFGDGEKNEYYLLTLSEKVTQNGDLQLKLYDKNEKELDNVELYFSLQSNAILSGVITSYLNAEDAITIALYTDGETEATYSATVKGDASTYSIEYVNAGNYIMKISKAGHVTREYTVVISDEDVTQDVKICPKGDVNLDGEVNADDLTALARHVAKIEVLTDDYALLSADVDDNGMLSADDLTKLARYVAKIISSLD